MRRPARKKELKSGYAFDGTLGAIYRFEHVPSKKAEEAAKVRQVVHVVETVNWTNATGEKQKMVHRNRYFAMQLSEAISIAVRIGMATEVWEDVIAIRPATDAEESAYLQLFEHYEKHMPEALAKLPEQITANRIAAQTTRRP